MPDITSRDPEYLELKKAIAIETGKYRLIGLQNPLRFQIVRHDISDYDIQNNIVFQRKIRSDATGKYVYLVKMDECRLDIAERLIENKTYTLRVPQFVDFIDYQNFFVWRYSGQFSVYNFQISSVLNKIVIIGNGRKIISNFVGLYQYKIIEHEEINGVRGVARTQVYSLPCIEFVNYDATNVRNLDVSGWNIDLKLCEHPLNGLKLTKLNNFRRMYRLLEAQPDLKCSEIDFQDIGQLDLGFYMSDSSEIDMRQFNFKHVQSMYYTFYLCENLKRILNFDRRIIEPTNKFFGRQLHNPLDNVKMIDISSIFYGCRQLEEQSIHSIVSGLPVRQMDKAFDYCEKLQTIPEIDFSHCIQFECAFQGTALNGELHIDGLNTHAVRNPIYYSAKTHTQDNNESISKGQFGIETDTEGLKVYKMQENSEDPVPVYGCKYIGDVDSEFGDYLRNLPNRLRIIGNSYKSAFKFCRGLQSVVIKNIQISLTGQDLNLSIDPIQFDEMFKDCENIKRVEIRNIKIECLHPNDRCNSLRVHFDSMFKNCENLEEVVIDGVIFQNIQGGITFKECFKDCKRLKRFVMRNVVFNIQAISLEISGGGVPANLNQMFYGCESLLDGEIDIKNIYYLAYDFDTFLGLRSLFLKRKIDDSNLKLIPNTREIDVCKIMIDNVSSVQSSDFSRLMNLEKLRSFGESMRLLDTASIREDNNN